jgi:hypothetical protein
MKEREGREEWIDLDEMCQDEHVMRYGPEGGCWVFDAYHDEADYEFMQGRSSIYLAAGAWASLCTYLHQWHDRDDVVLFNPMGRPEGARTIPRKVGDPRYVDEWAWGQRRMATSHHVLFHFMEGPRAEAGLLQLGSLADDDRRSYIASIVVVCDPAKKFYQHVKMLCFAKQIPFFDELEDAMPLLDSIVSDPQDIAEKACFERVPNPMRDVAPGQEAEMGEALKRNFNIAFVPPAPRLTL